MPEEPPLTVRMHWPAVSIERYYTIYLAHSSHVMTVSARSGRNTSETANELRPARERLDTASAARSATCPAPLRTLSEMAGTGSSTFAAPGS